MIVSLDSPAEVTPPAGPYSHVAPVEVGGGALLFLAGQIALDDDGNVAGPGDMAAQARRIFEIVGGILAAHGGGFGDVIHIRTFVTDLGQLPAYGAVRRSCSRGRRRPAPPWRSRGCSARGRCSRSR